MRGPASLDFGHLVRNVGRRENAFWKRMLASAADDASGRKLIGRRDSTSAATAAQLDAVEGLRGDGYEIVRYKEERGRFTDTRQLDEVPGLAGTLTDDQRAALLISASEK